jgi:nickel-type superoxide dismutase maturation protease
MLPTLEEGERLLVRRVRQVRLGDLVVCRSPGADHRIVVKRVAAIDDGEIILRGDNAGASTDSRHFGPVDPEAVLGVAFYRYAPTAGRLSRGRR